MYLYYVLLCRKHVRKPIHNISVYIFLWDELSEYQTKLSTNAHFQELLSVSLIKQLVILSSNYLNIFLLKE